METTASAVIELEINKDFHFDPRARMTADISYKALTVFASGFETAVKLEMICPIILDTNILLGYYGMSTKERSNLMAFFRKYNDRIYITRQIEQEYLKNRLAVIKKDFFDPLFKTTIDFIAMRTDIGNSLNAYIEKRKKILQHDYPNSWKELSAIQDTVNATIWNSKYYEEIDKQVKETTQNFKNIEYVDELLEVVSKFRLTGDLTNVEIEYLKPLFDGLKKEFSEVGVNERWRFSIPGCGDKKDDASGDFVIFNEILKFMKQKDTDCIFLTNDVTKEDWLQKNGNSHNHYLEHSFLLTGKMVYILHAERALKDISFENIHDTLEILKATYGTSTEKQYDVTRELREKIENNRLSMTANNGIAGDPHPGYVKTLDIKYKIREEIYEDKFKEGETFIIG